MVGFNFINEVILQPETFAVFLFTTAKGVTGAFEKVMKQKVRIINRSIISTKIDNNKTFWEFAFKEISESL